jgi:hypothetical protein
MMPRGIHRRPKALAKIEPRPDADDVTDRQRERDRRLAADTRTEAEKWLGDPPPDRSSLTMKGQAPARQSSNDARDKFS